jgi:O-antigen ligase
LAGTFPVTPISAKGRSASGCNSLPMSNKKFKQQRRLEAEQLNALPQMTKLAAFSKWMITVLIYGILILPALMFSPWHMSSFELTKNTFFLTLAVWLLAFYAIYKYEIKDFKIIKSQKIVLLILAALYFFKIVSLCLSPNKDLSFWGGFVRHEGLITHLFFAVFLFVVMDFIKSKAQIKKYLLALCFTAGIISFYGDLQKFGIDFSALKWDEMAYHRIASSMGNPLFLSMFLIFTSTYSLYCLKEFKNLYLRIAIVISVVLQLLAIVFTFTSSSVLAIAGGLMFWLFFYFYKNNRRLSYVIAGLTIIGSVFLGLIITEKISAPIFKDFTLSNTSNLQRVYVWQSSWQAFKDKPLFGWGNEVFNVAIEANQSVKLVTPLEANFDRAHNFIFDRLVMEGIFVALSLLTLLGYSIYRGLKRFVRDNDVLYLCAAALIFAASVNFLVSFPTIMSYVLLFFSIGIIFFNEDEVEFRQSSLSARNQLSTILLISLICFAIVATVQFFRPWRADLTMNEASRQRDGFKRLELMRQAVDIWPYREFVSELYKTQIFIVGKAAEVKNDKIFNDTKNEAQATVDQLLARFGNFYMTRCIAADFYKSTLNEQAMTAEYLEALKLAPTRYDIFWLWGDSLFALGKKDEALAKYQSAVDLDPTQKYPQQLLQEFKTKAGQ